jgi:hypothetical protein
VDHAIRSNGEHLVAQRDGGGPNYYIVKRHRVGDALLGLMRRAIDEGTTTYTKAGRVLGVKPTNVEPLLAPIRRT